MDNIYINLEPVRYGYLINLSTCAKSLKQINNSTIHQHAPAKIELINDFYQKLSKLNYNNHDNNYKHVGYYILNHQIHLVGSSLSISHLNCINRIGIYLIENHIITNPNIVTKLQKNQLKSDELYNLVHKYEGNTIEISNPQIERLTNLLHEKLHLNSKYDFNPNTIF